MSEPKDKFESLIDEWLKEVPLLPDFRGFFIKRFEEKCIEWLEQVYENSEQLYKSEGRRIALPGDVFKAVKIVNITWFCEDIEMFYEHYQQQLVDETQKLEIKAFFQYFVKYKDAQEYMVESEVTGEARTKQLESAAQARATWIKKFVQDIFLAFAPAVDAAEFKDIKEQRRMKSEDTAELLLEDAIRKLINAVGIFMSQLSPNNIQGLEELVGHMVQSVNDLLKVMCEEFKFLQLPKITVEQQKFINEACDRMIAEFDVKKAERGFDARTTESTAVAYISNEVMQAFFSYPSIADTPPYDVCSAHIDQRLKRKRIDLDLNVSPEVDVHESDADHDNS